MPIIVLGLDPASFKNMGCCVAEIYEDGSMMQIKERFTKIFDVDVTTKDNRFSDLKKTLDLLIKTHKVKVVVFERTQFGKSFILSQIYETIGVIKYVAKEKKLEIKEISPKTAKKQITGNGNAKKNEMMKAVKETFGLKPKDLSSEHEADAIALVYCYSIMYKEEIDKK